MIPAIVTANGRATEVNLPCSVDEFLVREGLLPRSVVIELNQEALSPSDFAQRNLQSGDRLEIIRIVAGG